MASFVAAVRRKKGGQPGVGVKHWRVVTNGAGGEHRKRAGKLPISGHGWYASGACRVDDFGDARCSKGLGDGRVNRLVDGLPILRTIDLGMERN